jgi:hypothetical protein
VAGHGDLLEESMTDRFASAAVAFAGLAVFILLLFASDGIWAQTAGGYDPMAPRRGGRAAQQENVPLNPDLGNLPDTAGVEDVYYTCSGCHSLAIVKQQRLTDARWDYTFNWMVEMQKMPEPDEETRQRILDYLKRHFSSEG